MAARKAQIPVMDGAAPAASVLCTGYEEPQKRGSGVKIQEEEDADTVAKAMELLYADKIL